MPAATLHAPPELLTYEAYMQEGEVSGSYDIIDGVRITLTGASIKHQLVSMKLTRLLLEFEAKTNAGRFFHAPLDVLIRREPLRMRQPDLLFLTHEQLRQRQDAPLGSAVEVTPHWLVEIFSPTETRARREGKLADYARIRVPEVWHVSPEAETIEVLNLRGGKYARTGIHGVGETVASTALKGLKVKVAKVFEE